LTQRYTIVTEIVHQLEQELLTLKSQQGFSEQSQMSLRLVLRDQVKAALDLVANVGEVRLLSVDPSIPVLQLQLQTMQEKLIVQADTIAALDASKTELTRELQAASAWTKRLQAQVDGSITTFQQMQLTLSSTQAQLSRTRSELGTSNEELLRLREGQVAEADVKASGALGDGPPERGIRAALAKHKELNEVKTKLGETEMALAKANKMLVELQDDSRVGQLSTDLAACKKQLAVLKADKEKRDKADAARLEALRLGDGASSKQ
jgi:hypothetical protein